MGRVVGVVQHQLHLAGHAHDGFVLHHRLEECAVCVLIAGWCSSRDEGGVRNIFNRRLVNPRLSSKLQLFFLLNTHITHIHT